MSFVKIKKTPTKSAEQRVRSQLCDISRCVSAWETHATAEAFQAVEVLFGLQVSYPPASCLSPAQNGSAKFRKTKPICGEVSKLLPQGCNVLGLLMVAVAGHLGPAVGLKTLSIHVCICPHFGM